MTNSQRLAKVRACLLRWISEHPPQQAPESPASSETEPESVPSIVRESILIRNEFFCGRRFFTSEHSAVWFVEEDELKIFHQDGSLLCVLSGHEIDAANEETSDVVAHPAAEILKLPAREDAVASDTTTPSESPETIRRAA